jgi:TRAP-type C4-dicarboxylate transport system substrate-binding protein
MKKYFWLSLVLVAFVFAFNTSIVCADSKPLKLKMQSAYPPGDNTYDVHSVELVKWIKDASKGRVEVDLYAPGALCDFTEMHRALQHGTIDIGAKFGMLYSGAMPMGDIVGGLPFAWGNGEEGMEEAIEVFFGPKYRLIDVVREAFAEKNQFFLTPNWCDAYPFLLNFPMNKISDLKGKKLRAGGSGAKWFTKAGAATVSIPGAEVYMAMKLGTVEGTAFPPRILEGQKLKEVVKYMILPGLAGPQTQHVFHKKSWEKIPADVRAILTDEKNLIAFYRRCGKAYIKGDDEAVAEATKYGVKTITLSKDVVKESRILAQSIWDEFAARDKHCAKAVEILKRFQRDKGGL